MTETQTLWAVKTNTDLTEGRGRQHVKHFCRTRATALRLARNGYVQGTDCPVDQVEVICLDGKYVLPLSLIQVVEPTKEDEATEALLIERQRALEKARAAGLTDAEIKLLGGNP